MGKHPAEVTQFMPFNMLRRAQWQESQAASSTTLGMRVLYRHSTGKDELIELQVYIWQIKITMSVFETMLEVAGFDRFCGVLLAPAQAAASAAVCSAATPFKMRVVTDATEAVDNTAAFAMGKVNEFSGGAANDPIGSWGFELNFAQVGCA